MEAFNKAFGATSGVMVAIVAITLLTCIGCCLGGNLLGSGAEGINQMADNIRATQTAEAAR